MKFYLNGFCYDVEKQEKSFYSGSYQNDEYWNFIKFEDINQFFENMIEDAKQDGRKEVRNAIKSALGLAT